MSLFGVTLWSHSVELDEVVVLDELVALDESDKSGELFDSCDLSCIDTVSVHCREEGCISQCIPTRGSVRPFSQH